MDAFVKEEETDESYDDEEDQQDTQYEYRKEVTSTAAKPKTDTCQKCSKRISSFCFSKAEYHAATHLNIKRFECGECGIKAWRCDQIRRHGKLKHRVWSVNEIKLSDEEEQELNNMINECFPGVSRRRRAHQKEVKKEEEPYQNNVPFEYNDYTGDEQESRKRPAESISQSLARCQKCQVFVTLDNFCEAEYHAITHTNMNRFECSVEGCKMKSNFYTEVYHHIKTLHRNVPMIVKAVELTPEEKRRMHDVVYECFSEFMNGSKLKRFEYQCVVCNDSVLEKDWNSRAARRNHALRHADIELFKCTEPNCNFKTNYSNFVSNHQRYVHGMTREMIAARKVGLTDQQKIEVERMTLRCFPQWVRPTHKVDQEMIEEKKVKIEEEEEVKKEPNDSNPYDWQDIGEAQPVECQEEPSEEEPVKQPEKKRQQARKKIEQWECRRCQKTISLRDYSAAERHAVTHTDLKRYKCPADKCNYSNWQRAIVNKHIRMHHNIDQEAREKNLSSKDQKLLKDTMAECFPDMVRKTREMRGKRYGYYCQVCHKHIIENDCSSRIARRNHVLKHNELYNCGQSSDMNPVLSSADKIAPTPEQTLKIKEAIVQCFPELKEELNDLNCNVVE